MSTLAQAYVQIIPSATGIKKQLTSILGDEMPSGGKESGRSFGASFVAGAKNIISTAGIGAAVATSMAALKEGSALEQSIGGIETLFKGSADKVKQYAEDAYKTAGMSANAYMQNVTSFSASLLQSLGGNTSKAAETANMAMVDMSDNANKMGTNMQNIQDAYQGFAKQNYTMLDNLKLGYGGTKTEMQRLLSDAQKITGQKYDINNLSDVYNAIHVIQKELGITGTTSKEASSTLEGSFNSMKAAAQNVLGNLVTGGDVKGSIGQLTSTITTYVGGNLVPALGRMFSALPSGIMQLITALGPKVGSGILQIGNVIAANAPAMIPKAVTAITGLINGFVQNLPKFIGLGIKIITSLAQGLINSIPTLIVMVPQIINGIADSIYGAIPKLLLAGGKIVLSLAQGIIQNIPLIIQNLPQIINAIINLFSMAKMASAGKNMIGNLLKGIKGSGPKIIQGLKSIGTKAVSSFTKIKWGSAGKSAVKFIQSAVSGSGAGIRTALRNAGTRALNAFRSISWSSVGRHVITGIISGISGAAGALFSKLRSLASSALSAAKKAFKIGSPSRLFSDGVGRFLPSGIAMGAVKNAKSLYRTMTDMAGLALSSAQSALNRSSLKTSFNVAPGTADGIVSGLGTVLQATAGYGTVPVNVTLYAFPNGPKMDEWVVNTYDRGKKKLG